MYILNTILIIGIILYLKIGYILIQIDISKNRFVIWYMTSKYSGTSIVYFDKER